MKLSAAAIILFSSTTISFAGNFTPIAKGKIVQSQACFNNCNTAFDLCVRLNSAVLSSEIANLSSAPVRRPAN